MPIIAGLDLDPAILGRCGILWGAVFIRRFSMDHRVKPGGDEEQGPLTMRK
jgi:hypothetical protein